MPYDSYISRGEPSPVYDNIHGAQPLIPEDAQKTIVKDAKKPSAKGTRRR
jgi:hypothetical protein